MALDWKVGTWHDAIARGTGGAAQADADQPVGHDCDDGMGDICARLAEAQARRAFAERQLVEFNHRLVNVLQMVVTLIGRQRRMQTDPAARDELDGLAARVHAAAALHRHLLPPRNHAHVDLGALIGELAVAIRGLTGLVCDVDAEPVNVPGEVAMHLAAAVNELAWNAYKHAYLGAPGGVLRIVCRRDADARLQLSVADRGLGLSADFDPRASEGFGLMLVGATARQFGGELRVDSERGTCTARASPGRELARDGASRAFYLYRPGF